MNGPALRALTGHSYESTQIVDCLASGKLARRERFLKVFIAKRDETYHGHGVPVLQIGQVLVTCKGTRRNLHYFGKMLQKLSL